jgi:GSH-dependent disulfide-bond oxidoreductase
MLALYTAGTPNGKKVPILLAELDVPYELHRIDLAKNEQKSPSFLAINPNGKIPALVVREDGEEPLAIFESGAILEYLARKHGRFLPTTERERTEVMAWLFWQVGGPGPMFGQAVAFGREEKRNEAAYEKFTKESKRLAGVLDGRLAGRDWVAGDYSIADIALFPWFEGVGKMEPGVLEGLAAVHAWLERMRARPAVQKGMSAV